MYILIVQLMHTLTFSLLKERGLCRARQHQHEQIALHSKHTELKAHQHFHQTAPGQNFVSGLSFAIRKHNQIYQTKATVFNVGY